MPTNSSNETSTDAAPDYRISEKKEKEHQTMVAKLLYVERVTDRKSFKTLQYQRSSNPTKDRNRSHGVYPVLQIHTAQN